MVAGILSSKPIPGPAGNVWRPVHGMIKPAPGVLSAVIYRKYESVIAMKIDLI